MPYIDHVLSAQDFARIQCQFKTIIIATLITKYLHLLAFDDAYRYLRSYKLYIVEDIQIWRLRLLLQQGARNFRPYYSCLSRKCLIQNDAVIALVLYKYRFLNI